MSDSKGIRFECVEDKSVHHIDTGEYTIGRGWLNCNDKRISRGHGRLKVLDDNSILLTSIHQNPLFYRLNQSDLMQVLNKDTDIALNVGDTFGLLPDLFWFTVLEREKDLNETPDLDDIVTAEQPVVPEAIAEATEENGGHENPSRKRKLPDWLSPDKKIRRSTDHDDNAEASTLNERSVDANDVEERSSQGNAHVEEALLEPVSTASDAGVNAPVTEIVRVKQEPVDEDEGTTAAATNQSTYTSHSNVRVKKEEPDSSEEAEPVASTSTVPIRESCRFGIRCYRRNLLHRTEEAHPGDTDYRRPTFDSPPPGTPSCPYGSACYRRNPEHFREYSHPRSNHKRPVNKVKKEKYDPGAKRPKREATNTNTRMNYDDNDDGDDSVDDDQEDPFGTDGSDDEYDPNKDDVTDDERGLSDDVVESDNANDSNNAEDEEN